MRFGDARDDFAQKIRMTAKLYLLINSLCDFPLLSQCTVSFAITRYSIPLRSAAARLSMAGASCPAASRYPAQRSRPCKAAFQPYCETIH
jgi:hypothetical protein